jgi:hypothetical protein
MSAVVTLCVLNMGNTAFNRIAQKRDGCDAAVHFNPVTHAFPMQSGRGAGPNRGRR